MRRALATGLALVLLSGCSLTDSGPDGLDFKTLVQSDSFVQRTSASDIEGRIGFGPLVLIRSAADEALFRERYGAGPFPTPVDYTRQSVVGMIFESPVANSRGTIENIAVKDDILDFSIRVDGDIVVGDGEVAVAYPAHFVRVGRLKETIHGFTARYTYPQR